jgi:hypothetical protein
MPGVSPVSLFHTSNLVIHIDLAGTRYLACNTTTSMVPESR